MNNICIVQNVTPEFQGLHKGEDTDYGILCPNTVYSCRWSQTIWRNLPPPYTLSSFTHKEGLQTAISLLPTYQSSLDMVG
jgi:hypothetical protein